MNEFSSYPKFEELRGLNILSIDYGEKVIGLGFYCPGREPFPIGAGRIINKGIGHFYSELAEVIEEQVVEVIVMGIPYFVDGNESEKTKEHKAIFNALVEKFPSVKFYQQDETLTTKSAKERMLNSPEYNFQFDPTKIDELSAVIILEDFIRS
ncbi:RNAse H domain protein, YqgF family [Bacteriovorax sp. BAL6_X]|uniref:Holliday junction resolvase RuvX n=1 Tax=Bacteriovorax sp. BAL6_X TaxID=1201290 RepID=UPI0003866B47|nr:Holliday junction resolvase RuvX [Bacteriovorax sp. BAL6_X]EPZ49732.1 RNAse H domain protein, YqgF family [Bacteriovorax sp. BAL6_X]